MLFDYLVTGGILAHNPVLSLRAPRQSVTKGKTPTLSAEDAGELLRAIETNNLAGLRERALLGLMVFTFARVSAALGVNVGDLFRQKKACGCPSTRKAARSMTCRPIARDARRSRQDQYPQLIAVSILELVGEIRTDI
jgi:site-specific recombinase XerD